jgi:hypothetical protein
MKFALQSWQLMPLILAGWINHHEQDVIEYLRAENRVLRENSARSVFCSTMINGGAWR